MKKSFLFFAIIFIASAFYSFTVQGQIEYPEDKVKWEVSVEQDGENVVIVASISIVNHWHIYANKRSPDSFSIPTEIQLEKSSNYKTVGGVIEPKPEHIFDEIVNEDLYLHSGKIKMKRKIKVRSDIDFVLKGVFSFQTCDDTHCLPPYEGDFEVKIKGVSTMEDDIETTDVKIDFSKVSGDETKDAEGSDYVKVNDKWYKVPAGNTVAFYKKYLILGGKHEE